MFEATIGLPATIYSWPIQDPKPSHLDVSTATSKLLSIQVFTQPVITKLFNTHSSSANLRDFSRSLPSPTNTNFAFLITFNISPKL